MKIDFGDYVEIEQKRYDHDNKNEMYLYKVIRRLKSNYYVDVPVQCPEKECFHKREYVDVIACICCGVDETIVNKFRLSDVKDIKKKGGNNVKK